MLLLRVVGAIRGESVRARDPVRAVFEGDAKHRASIPWWSPDHPGPCFPGMGCWKPCPAALSLPSLPQTDNDLHTFGAWQVASMA